MSSNSEWRSSEVSTGTTIIAVKYNGGVVIGSDSRASMGGVYVSSRVINKVVRVHDQIFCCMSGSLADAQAVTNAVIHRLNFHSMQMGEPPLVKSVASIMREFCYDNKEELSAGFIVAGWDRRRGPQVFDVSLGGMIVEQDFTIGGSGSTYIYGYTDAKYKPSMTRDECITFTTNALTLAMNRDNVSGGVVHLAVVDESGAQRQLIPGNKLVAPRHS